jgi:hypothetical protein
MILQISKTIIVKTKEEGDLLELKTEAGNKETISNNN